jgi:hypothetical protein
MFTPKLTPWSVGLALVGLVVVPTASRAQQPSPEARAEARRLADQDLKEMPLHELRRPLPDAAATRQDS